LLAKRTLLFDYEIRNWHPRPRIQIKLSKIDANETCGITKEKAVARFCELCEKVDELQHILYAEHQRSLLLIFQAMDTGGKDGAVQALCGGLNPAGLEVRNFKAPFPRLNSTTIFSRGRTKPRQARE
jgi:polyphosphate kinase 2 (PPK2 family)